MGAETDRDTYFLNKLVAFTESLVREGKNVAGFIRGRNERHGGDKGERSADIQIWRNPAEYHTLPRYVVDTLFKTPGNPTFVDSYGRVFASFSHDSTYIIADGVP